MKRSGIVVVGLALLTPPLAAQGADGLPTRRSTAIAPGALLDLDSGAVLPEQQLGAMRADLRFDRDGLGFFLLPLAGGIEAQRHDQFPHGEDWRVERIRLPRRSTDPIVAFVRTDHGVARVELAVVEPYSVASALVHWVVVPPTDPVFLDAPTSVRSRWDEQRLVVEWQGEQQRYLVEVTSGQQVRKEAVDGRRVVLTDLDPQAVHRIRVRGVAGGAISLPGEVVQHGPCQPVVRRDIEFGDRWYDATGGVRLSSGEQAEADAELVCYLYGVYVPGGGVQKIGSGRDTFARQSQLPGEGYLPSYGRLDEFDVLAVRLADGRCGLVYIEPTVDGDVRSGMRLVTAFLPDGRSRLLPAPQAAAETGAQDRAVTVSWSAIEGADGYVVTVAGRAPIETDQLSVTLSGLATDRVHEVQVVARSATGDVSAACSVRGHTFGPQARVGRARLQAQDRCVVFATGATDGEFDLGIVGGAGGASVLTFAARCGSAASGGREFGDFTGLAVSAETTRFDSDSRDPDCDRFFVFTVGGGCAAVSIVQRGWPETTIDYVWLPVLPK